MTEAAYRQRGAVGPMRKAKRQRVGGGWKNPEAGASWLGGLGTPRESAKRDSSSPANHGVLLRMTRLTSEPGTRILKAEKQVPRATFTKTVQGKSGARDDTFAGVTFPLKS